MIFGSHPNTVRCACLFPLLIPFGASFGFAASHEAAPAPTPYPVPQWVRECTRPFFVNDTSKEAMSTYKDYGAQAVFNVGIYLTYYDGKAFYTAEPDANKRLVTKTVGPEEIAKYKAVVDNIHAQGIRAIGTMTPMWEIQVLNDHPDWQHLSSPDAQSRDAMQGFPPPMGSWMSPFGDWYIEKNIKMVKTWGWDGQCIDGFGFATLDYNPYNRKAYKEFCGAEVPPKDDPNDPNYRRYLHWRMEQWGRYVHKWEGALKKVNKDFAFIPWSTGPGRWWHWTALPRIEGSELGNLMVDAPVVEIFWDFPPDQGSNLLPAFTARFYRGFCEERPVWMHAYFRSQGQQQAVTPRVESELRLYTMLTNGAAAPVAVWMSDKNTPVKHYVDVIKAREKFLIDAKSVKWAAMLMSENSRLFYGISGTRPEFGGPFIGSGVDSKVKSDLPISQKRMPAHVESSLGVFRAAQEAHVPLDMISDRILENGEWMKEYKVLILPDAACLSDKALANIREFVKAGGGLVATQASSLYTETGEKRADFGLADLFCAKFEGIVDNTALWPNYEHTAMLDFPQAHPITKDDAISGIIPYTGDRVDYIGWAADVTSQTGATVPVTRQTTGWDAEVGLRPTAHPKNPFLITSEHGKGRVAYFAAALDQAYFVTPYTYERPLLINAMRWAAQDNVPMVEVKAPMAVTATFYEQAAEKRLVIHLLSEINTLANRALPLSNSPVREEIVPIAGITLTIRDASIQRVWQEPEHVQLEIRKLEAPIGAATGAIEVTVPRLDLHSMIVGERG